jgi:4-hydroxy-tetrahydrodipicolinate reductase
MNIALIGHGTMGREVEQAARARKITVKTILTIENNLTGIGISPDSLREVDVCIDFSVPAAVLSNIKAVARCGKNIVVGTTGWYDKLEEVKKTVEKHNIGLLYAPNLSIGMNLFYQILTSATAFIDKVDLYDVAVSEIHHRGKADSPSGTALALGQIILQHMHRKRAVAFETPHTALRPDQLQISSTRLGSVVGTHSVTFDSEADTIAMVHTAKNRSGFAIGALIAAEWLNGKKGLFTMKDVLTL